MSATPTRRRLSRRSADEPFPLPCHEPRRVEAVGAGRFAVGDLVHGQFAGDTFGRGTFAERVAITERPSSGALELMPEGLVPDLAGDAEQVTSAARHGHLDEFACQGRITAANCRIDDKPGEAAAQNVCHCAERNEVPGAGLARTDRRLGARYQALRAVGDPDRGRAGWRPGRMFNAFPALGANVLFCRTGLPGHQATDSSPLQHVASQATNGNG